MKQIDVPSMSGNFGILPNHVPILAVLKPGILTVIEEGDKAKKFFGKYSSRLGPNNHGLFTYIQVNVFIGNTSSWLNGG